MSNPQLRNANLGKSKANLTGSGGVGYALYDAVGNLFQARTTSGVHQLTPGSGLYAALIPFPDLFSGSIVWDTGEVSSSLGYAIEQYNTEENDSRVYATLQQISGTINVLSGAIDFLVGIEGGRWKIVGTQMLFYKSDNTTLVATFDLFDSAGSPSNESVFERRRV